MATGFSKATRGLRQSDIIKDQHFKLVFVYPMLVDQTLSKYSDLLRDFVSTSMLKELFISNSLNLVNVASQIYPLTDEKGQETNIRSTIANISGSSGTFGGSGQVVSAQLTAHPLESQKHEIQQRIHEKTAIIRKFLATDPKLKALNPYVEMITMDNLIDVPVIVGTKKFDVDSAITQFIFLVSIADKLPLDQVNNFDKIFKRIETTKPENAYQLLNNLVPSDPNMRERVKTWFKNFVKEGVNKVMRRLMPKGMPLGTSITSISKNIKKPIEFDNLESLAILQVAQTNLSQTKLFFKFCYDTNLLKSQFGIDVGQSQISTTIRKVNGKIENSFTKMFNDFTSTLGRIGGPAITSVVNMMYPAGSTLDDVELVNDTVYTELLNDLQKITFDELLMSINSAIESGSIEESDTKIKKLKELCVREFTDSDEVLRKSYNTLTSVNVQVRSPMTNYGNMSNFLEEISDIGKTCFNQSRTVEQALSSILGMETGSILNHIYSTIETRLSSLLNKMSQYYTVNFSNVSFLRAAPDDSFPKNQRTITTLQEQFLTSLVPYIYFLYMYQLQIALCNYVSIVDVEIETTKNNVLDIPNYTLVVPIQTIEAVANAIVAKSWQQLISQEGSGRGFVGAVGDNYIKGVVKFMKQRLRVPNLIVVDEQKGDIYYQLMHQSVPQKTKLRTLETFIQLTMKEELQGQLPNSRY